MMNNYKMDALYKYQKQWLQIPSILQKQLALLEPFLKEQKKSQEIFNKIKFHNYQFPDLLPHTEQINQYQEKLNNIISPAFQELHCLFGELPEKTQKAMLLLAEDGWYLYLDLNMSMSSFRKIIQKILDKKFTNDALIQYFEGQLKEIEKSIITKFPHRKHIIAAALKAHIRGNYYLSIPVLLTQIDGICKETVEKYFFIKNHKKPETAIYVKQIATDILEEALLSPLVENTPINKSEKQRENGFNKLNRHMVLHGESLDYGTKENSLKTLSLINYVSQVLKQNV